MRLSVLGLKMERSLAQTQLLPQASFYKHFFGFRLTQEIAAAAARINASIQAKKGIQHVDVPPIRTVMSLIRETFNSYSTIS